MAEMWKFCNKRKSVKILNLQTDKWQSSSKRYRFYIYDMNIRIVKERNVCLFCYVILVLNCSWVSVQVTSCVAFHIVQLQDQVSKTATFWLLFSTFHFFFQLVETVNTPGDITCLIGPVMKLLPSHNTNVKKTAYSVLPRYIC